MEIDNNICVHHWRIDPPDGSQYLPGRCKKCGAEQYFKSSPPDKALYIPEVRIVSLEQLVDDESAEEDDYD